MLDANVDMVKVKELLGQAHIGDRMLLKDVQGKPLEAIEISLPVFARCKTAAW
jgi:uncharacterized protein YxjI